MECPIILTQSDIEAAALRDRTLIRTAEKVWIPGEAGPVGFLMVRQSRGYTRLGPFFIHPDFRRQGRMRLP